MARINYSLTMMAGLWAIASATALAQPVVRTSSVTVFNGATVIAGGSATLVRSANGLTATFHTTELKPGTAYTLWWVIYNHPEKCSPPACNLDDVLPFPGNTAAGVSLLHASGHVTGQSGNSNFAGHLRIGDTSGAMFGPGLLDPFKADVHLALRSHGQPIPGNVEAQISSFNGGCPPNSCINEQQALFPAAAAADDTLPRLHRIESDLAQAKDMLMRIMRALGIQQF